LIMPNSLHQLPWHQDGLGHRALRNNRSINKLDLYSTPPLNLFSNPLQTPPRRSLA
jgi:hypothetical protein